MMSLCRPPRMLSTALWYIRTKCTGVKHESPTLEERLHIHFDEHMHSDKVPLFSNFELYKRSLPTRVQSTTGEKLLLYQLPHWTCDDDLKFMADQLEKPPRHRLDVKYISAPAGSGKTSSVLAAFLESASRKNGFTHYLYLPFNNSRYHYQLWNNDNIFEDSNDAMDQGASFIHQCVKSLLECKRPILPGAPFISEALTGLVRVPCDTSPPESHHTEGEIDMYLKNIFPPGQRYRILLHLDEHRKMCKRSGVDIEGDDTISKGASFSRGAMSSLANVPNVGVVTTYLSPPPLPSSNSSGVCRTPVAIPNLDLKKAIQAIDELKFPDTHKVDDGEQERLRATLLFRLGMMFIECGIENLHQGGKLPLLQEFKEKVKECITLCTSEPNNNTTEDPKATKLMLANSEDTTRALKECIKLCTSEPEDYTTIDDPNAAKLLLGVKDEELESLTRQVSNTVIVYDLVSCSLMSLLHMDDPKYKIYSKGCMRLHEVLYDAVDCLSSTPLEAAYNWSLSCGSAVRGKLLFGGGFNFEIRCKKLEPGRIFPHADKSTYNLNEVEPNVMYYAKERNGNTTHPLADMYFCTEEGELVLIDITGGSGVEKKVLNLSEWIDEEQKKLNKQEQSKVTTLRGVILAPVVTDASETRGCVRIVRGKDARKMLGGLSQVFRWLTVSGRRSQQTK